MFAQTWSYGVDENFDVSSAFRRADYFITRLATLYTCLFIFKYFRYIVETLVGKYKYSRFNLKPFAYVYEIENN